MSLAIEKPFCDNILKEIRKKMVVQTETLAKKNAIRLVEGEIAILENLEDGSALQLNTEE